MKIKISYIIGIVLMSVAVVFNSCEEKDDYNYNNIEPIIFSMAGPSPTAAHGDTGFPATYSVNYRGGSTYAWEIGGQGGTFVLDATYPSIARVTFNQSDVNTTATITVTETTEGGKVSPPFTRNVNLLAFCPQDMAPWAGTMYIDQYLGATYYGNHEIEAKVVTTALNTIRIEKFFDWVVKGFWGENWIPGRGGEGDFILQVDCNWPNFSGQVLIGETYEWTTYWLAYSGSFDEANNTITINYDISWTATGAVWNSFTANVSYSSPKSFPVIENTITK